MIVDAHAHFWGSGFIPQAFHMATAEAWASKEPGRKPEQAADPDAEEPQHAPGAVMQPNLELERASRRPADRFRRLVREEHMGDEANRQADHADAKHQRV